MYHGRTKHIDVRFYFIWEIFYEGNIELQKIHTKENPVDMLTKIISGGKVYTLQIVTPYPSSCLRLVEFV